MVERHKQIHIRRAPDVRLAEKRKSLLTQARKNVAIRLGIEITHITSHPKLVRLEFERLQIEAGLSTGSGRVLIESNAAKNRATLSRAKNNVQRMIGGKKVTEVEFGKLVQQEIQRLKDQQT